jgi:hypothetical protein
MQLLAILLLISSLTSGLVIKFDTQQKKKQPSYHRRNFSRKGLLDINKDFAA